MQGSAPAAQAAFPCGSSSRKRAYGSLKLTLLFIFKYLFILFLLCVGLCSCMSLYAPHACSYLRRPEEGVRSPGSRVTGSCELSDRDAGS